MCSIVLSRLKENRKIATATHNIFAYRVRLEGGVMAQDCEDDGETKAGSRMLHLMAVSGRLAGYSLYFVYISTRYLAVSR